MFFAKYMESSCKFVAHLLPKRIEGFWKSINSFVDIGGGSGFMTISICKEHNHLKGINSDLK
jgi:hypothetical protein